MLESMRGYVKNLQEKRLKGIRRKHTPAFGRNHDKICAIIEWCKVGFGGCQILKKAKRQKDLSASVSQQPSAKYYFLI